MYRPCELAVEVFDLRKFRPVPPQEMNPALQARLEAQFHCSGFSRDLLRMPGDQNLVEHTLAQYLLERSARRGAVWPREVLALIDSAGADECHLQSPLGVPAEFFSHCSRAVPSSYDTDITLVDTLAAQLVENGVDKPSARN